mmetsp:Transcript_10436/g.20836  ORF Transcript_10436/g.20836 Transcript_10436/m.20836 type:complete len:223 (+) Transcript_10436:166-834(+)
MVPHSANSARTLGSSISYDRFPMKTVVHPSGFSLTLWLFPALVLGKYCRMESHRSPKVAWSRARAASKPGWVVKVMIAVPELRPSDWRGRSTVVIAPQSLKKSRTSSSPVVQGRPRTKTMVASGSASAAADGAAAGAATVGSTVLRFLAAGAASASESESEELSELSDEEELLEAASSLPRFAAAAVGAALGSSLEAVSESLESSEEESLDDASCVVYFFSR